MDWDDLKTLVDSWHEAASAIPDYKHTTEDGDGVQLLLLARRTKEGGVSLTAMSMADYLSTVSPGELLGVAGMLTAEFPSIPTATIKVLKQAQ